MVVSVALCCFEATSRAENDALDSKVETLLSEMTLEEKVYQLCAVYFGSGDEIFQDSGVITEKLVSDQLGDHNKKSETQRP
jgi:hypothetical protein